MTRYQRDKFKVWCVVVRGRGEKDWTATKKPHFVRREECQRYIDEFRAESAWLRKRYEHRPMMFLPAKERTR